MRSLLSSTCLVLFRCAVFPPFVCLSDDSVALSSNAPFEASYGYEGNSSHAEGREPLVAVAGFIQASRPPLSNKNDSVLHWRRFGHLC